MNHVICEETGKIIEYRHLILQVNKDVGNNGMCNKLGLLSKVCEEHKGTNTCLFIALHKIPQGRKAAYCHAAFDIILKNKKPIMYD